MTEQDLYPTLATESSERRISDRRQTTLQSILLGGLGKHRRLGPRRITDRFGHYVDWYESRLLAVSLTIYLLCCIDAWFTLTLLNHGAREVNVLMDLLIRTDVNTFIQTKLTITAVGLIYLVAHSSFRVRGLLLVRHVLYLLLGVYITLFIYQLNMLATGVQHL